jgi:Domain of unknown function (DUF4386)
MQNVRPATLANRYNPKPFRTTARVVGVLYLAGMAIGIPANLLVLSILDGPDRLSAIAASSTLLAMCVVLWLFTVAGDAAHGVLMFPVLKRHSERAAVGYLAARIVDATFIAVMALLILVQIPVAIEYLNAGSADTSYLQAFSGVFNHAYLYAYEFGMIAVGVAGLILCSAFYRTQLVPRLLAVWGLVGYAILLSGSLLQILGFNLNTIHAIPGGLWELFIGVWLIAKGFNTSSDVPSEPTISSTTPDVTPPLVATAAP